jgi:hypothetical protein
MHFTWSGFAACNAATWAMHGRVAGLSDFYRVVDNWDAPLLTAVSCYMESASRPVILATCHCIGFFANLSVSLYLLLWGGCSPLIILYGRNLSRHLLAFWLSFTQIVHVCILTCWVTSLVTFDL